MGSFKCVLNNWLSSDSISSSSIWFFCPLCCTVGSFILFGWFSVCWSGFDHSQTNRFFWDQLHCGIQSAISFLAVGEKKVLIFFTLKHTHALTHLVCRLCRFHGAALCSVRQSSHGGLCKQYRGQLPADHLWRSSLKTHTDTLNFQESKQIYNFYTITLKA